MSLQAKIDQFLNGSPHAVVGASRNRSKYGNKVLRSRLADALGDYLSNHGLRQWHGTAGRRRVLDEFQPRRMWQAMLGEYVRLLRLAGCPVPAAAGQGDAQRRVA